MVLPLAPLYGPARGADSVGSLAGVFRALRPAQPCCRIGSCIPPIRPPESWSGNSIIPERGLFTGVAIFGAVGSGKTSACMNPFAKQLLGWQADDPRRRAATLVLEVKGDFCHDIRQILQDAGRGEDYMELNMSGGWRWKPLSATWLDSYSLAHTISSLLNQLFGKGKEPFYQQAYTNQVRWIIEFHRVMPKNCVTLQQVYRCAIDPEFFAQQIRFAGAHSDSLNTGTVFIDIKTMKKHKEALGEWNWRPVGKDHLETTASTPLREKLAELKMTYQVRWESRAGTEVRERVEVVKRWYIHDRQKLDNKIKSSIVEGVSVFFSIFDMPDIVRVFCPPPPPDRNRQAGRRGRERSGPDHGASALAAD